MQQAGLLHRRRPTPCPRPTGAGEKLGDTPKTPVTPLEYAGQVGSAPR